MTLLPVHPFDFSTAFDTVDLSFFLETLSSPHVASDQPASGFISASVAPLSPLDPAQVPALNVFFSVTLNSVVALTQSNDLDAI